MAQTSWNAGRTGRTLYKSAATAENQQLKICMKYMFGFPTICIKETILNDSSMS